MRKHNLLFASVALTLLAASCSQEDVLPPSGADGNVNFTVQLPADQFSTRAFSDGKTALDLDYAVYDGTTDKFVTKGTATFPSDALQTTVSLQLANGRGYKVAFFASSKAQNVYTFNADATNASVSVDYSKMTDYNTTDYDCFYALDVVPKVTGPVNRNVTLTRPLAQINWGTDDLGNYAVVAEDAYGAGAANLVSSVTVKNVYNAFGLLDGKVTGDATDVTFIAKARPNGETFPVSKGQGVTPDYEYLSMQYVLVDAGDNTLVEATLTPANGKSGNDAVGTPVVVANLPVQRNYRTNIYGSLLTSPAEFNVEKIPAFDGENGVEIEAGKTVVAKTTDDFVKALSAGSNVYVPANTEIDLSNASVENLTVTSTLSINLNEGSTVKLGADNYFDVKENAALTLKGSGKITNAGTPDPSVNGATKNLIRARNAKVVIEGVSLENDPEWHKHGVGNENPYNNAAFQYWGDCDITIDHAEMTSGGFTVCGMVRGGVNTSKISITNSKFDSNSSNKHGDWAYNLRLFGKEGVMENCEVEGIQGGVSVEEITMTFRNCKITTKNSEDNRTDGFYAIYATNKGVAIVESGLYAGANAHSTLAEGKSALVSGDNDVDLPDGSFIIKGGYFSGKAYGTKVWDPADGMQWVETTEEDGVDTSIYKWTVK